MTSSPTPTHNSRSTTVRILDVIIYFITDVIIASRQSLTSLSLLHAQSINPPSCQASSFVQHHIYTLTNKKFELMLTGRAKAYSSSCSQAVSLSPAISSRLLRGYRSLMPSCARFLKPRKLRLGPSKSTFNAKNYIRSLSMSVSIGFGAIRSCNVSHSPKSPKNPWNPVF